MLPCNWKLANSTTCLFKDCFRPTANAIIPVIEQTDECPEPIDNNLAPIIHSFIPIVQCYFLQTGLIAFVCSCKLVSSAEIYNTILLKHIVKHSYLKAEKGDHK